MREPVRPSRHSELQDGLTGIATNLLVERLRQFEVAGVIGRDGEGQYELTEWGRKLTLAPASPGYWALDAYRNVLIASPAELATSLGMPGVFALVGVATAALSGAGPHRTASLRLRGYRARVAR